MTTPNPWYDDYPFDDEVFGLLDEELVRQRTTLQLIASENLASPAVLAAAGSVLTNKYSEGYPTKRYYGGNQVIDKVEDLARERLKSLLNAEHVNVQPHSGANANAAAYLAFMEPGDTALGLRLDQGGHITHGLPVSLSGKFYNFISYGVREDTEQIDLDQVRDLAIKHRPKLIVCGATAYPRIIDAKPYREIADEVGAFLMFDAAHVIGLIAGGQHPSPVGIADVVTFTTHKALRGPRGGCIVTQSQHADRVDKAIFPGLQGGPLDHIIAAKAVAFREAAQPEFKAYAQRIVENAKALGSAMSQQGFRLVSGGTDNHLLLVDLQPFDADLTGKQAQITCDEAGISLNKNQIPNDPRSPFVTSGVRIGTPAVTTCGLGVPQMSEIADFVGRALRGRADAEVLAKVRHEVNELVAAFPPYPATLGDDLRRLAQRPRSA
jgi:glycine hydroxymethyltransferase